MTNEKEVTERVARISDQAVGDKKACMRPKTTYPPHESGTSHQFMILIQGYTKNIPLSDHTFYEGGPAKKVSTQSCEI